MKPGSVLLRTLVVVLALPQCAWANAGTPLMWATALHMVFGNALIGVGEGLLLARLFSLRATKCIVLMVLANYASAWLGGLFIGGSIVSAIPMDLSNAWKWFWIMVLVTYCMTLLLEWPFVAYCFRGTSRGFRRSVGASLTIQSASYLLLFGWYWMASGTSLYTEMNIAAPADLSLPESVLVYFISPADGHVYSRPLVGESEQRVFELGATNRNDRLFLRPNTKDPNRWDLVASVRVRGGGYAGEVKVLENMSVEVASDSPGTRIGLPQHDGTWSDVGKAPAVGDTTGSPWEFSTGFYPGEGLRISNKVTGEQTRLSYETPFAVWPVRNAMHLPSDKVLFQLGDDQICAFDPVTRRVALLWRGRGPVAVIPKPPAEPSSTATDRQP